MTAATGVGTPSFPSKPGPKRSLEKAAARSGDEKLAALLTQIYPGSDIARLQEQTDVRLAAERALAPRWTLRPEVIYTRNDSTLPPNDFNRVQALITTRYAF